MAVLHVCTEQLTSNIGIMLHIATYRRAGQCANTPGLGTTTLEVEMHPQSTAFPRSCSYCGRPIHSLHKSVQGLCNSCYQYLNLHGVFPPPLILLRRQAKVAGMMVCRVCETILPKSAFHRMNGEPNRLQTECKDCAKSRRKAEGREQTRIRLGIRNCLVCGEEFVPHSNKRLVCSATCKHRYWKANHPIRRKEIDAKRQAIERSSKADQGAEHINRLFVFERDEWICQLCGSPVAPSLPARHAESATIDHIVPLSKGGAHCYANVQLAHHACNSAKRDGGRVFRKRLEWVHV